MMNRRSTLTAISLSIAVCASALAGCAHRNDASVKAAIQAAYNKQSAAYVNRQPDAVMAVCAPNYTEVNGNNVDSRTQVADTITGFIVFAQKLDASATVRSVSVHDNVADVTVDRHFDMLTVPVKTKNEAAPTQHHFVSDETNNDTWVNEQGKGWLKLKSITVESNSSFDGKSAK
jgi:hypothetical protein